ncbi:MAG: glycosyltransferase family 4 protein [Vicinamibacterales bacterium]
MKVAVFTDNDFDKVNGVTTALTAVLRYAPPDIQPRVYTAADLGVDSAEYLALRSFGLPIPFYGEMKMYVPHWRQYLRRVQADGIDVLHLTTPGPMGLTALWVRRVTGLPMVGSFHTDLAAYTELLSGSPRLGGWMRDYMRWMYGRCARVLVPSDATRALMVRAESRADRIDIWSRGVDTRLFTPAVRSERLRAAWGVSEGCPALLYVGRVSREKGLGLLPALSGRLRAAGRRHRLVVAGDGPMRRELAAACPDAVFTGSLGREAVAEVFASADVFVFPSRTDTAGNVVLEAQASGLPVLVSDAGGPREHMVHGLTGLVCAGASTDAWFEAASGLVGDPGRRRALGASAREFARGRRWEMALEPLYAAYRAAARGRLVSDAA